MLGTSSVIGNLFDRLLIAQIDILGENLVGVAGSVVVVIWDVPKSYRD